MQNNRLAQTSPPPRVGPICGKILDSPLNICWFMSQWHQEYSTQCEELLRRTTMYQISAIISRWCANYLITGRSEVLAKVMFLQASVILSTGGSPIFRGGLQFFGGSPIFLGGVSPIFQGGASKFLGGCLQFFGGSPIFRGGLQPEYGQRSAGTHSTGMHSCFICGLLKLSAL